VGSSWITTLAHSDAVGRGIHAIKIRRRLAQDLIRLAKLAFHPLHPLEVARFAIDA
jgi:hypothetical protein